MILHPELKPTDPQSVLDYYKAHYSEVHVVSCNKCGVDLAVEIRGAVSGHPVNDNGFTVLPVGPALLSSRVRTDGTMGYQCGNLVDNPAWAEEEAKIQAEVAKAAESDVELIPRLNYLPRQVMCDNDTRASAIEEELSPRGEFLPHELAAIHHRYQESGHKPLVVQQGHKEIHETFTRERIK